MLLLCFGCSQNKKLTEEQKFEKSNKVGPFFNFDKIYHYSIDIADSDLPGGAEYPEDPNESYEIKKWHIIQGHDPKKLDTLIEVKLLENGFLVNEIPKAKLKPLNELFSTRYVKYRYESECIPVYRDILIFKKNGKIVGIAKLCFACDQHVIRGSKTYADFFGTREDFTKLRKLLGKKPRD